MSAKAASRGAGTSGHPEEGQPAPADYRALFDRAVDPALITSIDGAILRANPAACRALGLDEAKLRGRGLASLCSDEGALRAFLALRERGGSATGELSVSRADGTVLQVEVASATIGGAGDERYAYLSFRDATVRHRTEAALRESEQKLRLLAEAMPQIVCVLASDGAAQYVNRAWETFSGLDLDATRRVSWAGALHPDDVEVARECRRRVLKSLSPQSVELRYRRADGTYRWFLSRLAPVVEGQRVVRLVGAAMDIDEQKAAERALRAELALKDQLSKVAASVPGVVCSYRLGPDGRASMPFSSPAVSELFGIPQEALARDMAPATARTHPDDAGRVRREIEASAASLEPWRSLFRYEHPTRGLRWFLGASVPAREPDGSTIWHGYVADVTDHKVAEDALERANERLRDADKHKDEFLAMLSHELRNPLAPIRNSLYVLRHGDGSRSEPALSVIERQTDHLTRLVDDLLDVTRVARGKIQLRRARLDLRDVVRRSGEDFRAAMDQRGVALRVSLPDEPVVVDVDATRLAQVVGNLVHNALKFTRAGDEVVVALEVAGGEARVRVRDTGAGIDPALLANIFDPFVQADRTRARTEGGLGLGLALVRGLVELHGGSVRVASAGRGHGAEFTVALPLAPPAREEPPPAPGARPRASAGRRVLVVDDNRDAADSLAELVGALGHRPEAAYTAADALARVDALRPDAVLCDIGLPVMDGYEVARRIRASSPRPILLVAVSGYAQPEDVARALEAGFDAHVAKPPDPERLLELLS